MRQAANLFDQYPRLALVTARVLVGPEEVEDPTCQIMAQSPLRREHGMPGPALLGFLAGASVVRRDAFLEAGGFSNRVVIGGEEAWLAAELAARQWWLCYVEDLVVYHYPSALRDAQAGARRKFAMPCGSRGCGVLVERPKADRHAGS